jgi:dTDP-4-amino-4,6-dideoxygalactose transaminase
MDALLDIARRHGLLVIEDAAQGYGSTYKGRPLGTLGALGAFSFHETKTIISGEGGALIVNDAALAGRAEIIREKGTNRSSFFRGQVDKYTWVDVGSSFLPSELVAAFLWAQLQEADRINAERLAIWQRYHDFFEPLEAAGKLRRPIIPPDCTHNGHMYYLLLDDLAQRSRFIAALKARDIGAVFHYVPLHSSPAGQRFGRVAGPMAVTDRQSERLVRLPLWLGMGDQQELVAQAAQASL